MGVLPSNHTIRGRILTCHGHLRVLIELSKPQSATPSGPPPAMASLPSCGITMTRAADGLALEQNSSKRLVSSRRHALITQHVLNRSLVYSQRRDRPLLHPKIENLTVVYKRNDIWRPSLSYPRPACFQ